jgi:hypothetical protein
MNAGEELPDLVVPGVDEWAGDIVVTDEAMWSYSPGARLPTFRGKVNFEMSGPSGLPTMMVGSTFS